MNPAPNLLSLIRDPVGLSSPEREAHCLVNRTASRRYPIVEGIPTLLDAESLSMEMLRQCLVPPGATDVAYEEIRFRVLTRLQGGYFLTFRARS